MTPEQVERSVRDELRPGGRPALRYRELGVNAHCDVGVGVRLTADILINFEDRLCELELLAMLAVANDRLKWGPHSTRLP